MECQIDISKPRKKIKKQITTNSKSRKEKTLSATVPTTLQKGQSGFIHCLAYKIPFLSHVGEVRFSSCDFRSNLN